MRKGMGKVLAAVLSLSLAVGAAGFSSVNVSADAALDTKYDKYIAFGADLKKDEKATVLKELGVSESELGDYKTIEITNKDEHDYISNAGFGVGNAVTNRQVNKKYYVPNGAIYILDYELLKMHRTYYRADTIGFIMNSEDSVDIDTLTDFQYAEFLLQRRR